MRYAKVEWSVEDVLTLRPKWSEKQAEEFLIKNQGQIQDVMVERGWAAIEFLLAME